MKVIVTVATLLDDAAEGALRAGSAGGEEDPRHPWNVASLVRFATLQGCPAAPINKPVGAVLDAVGEGIAGRLPVSADRRLPR